MAWAEMVGPSTQRLAGTAEWNGFSVSRIFLYVYGRIFANVSYAIAGCQQKLISVVHLLCIRAAEGGGHVSADAEGACRRNLSAQSTDPFVDEEGFLRVGGRLENPELPSHMKHPVILPGDHALTMGLIIRCHARQLHTLAILKQQYWVLKGRTQVKKVIRHCFACRHAMARPVQPRMAALPSSRVVEAAAFAHTGLDFTGPLLIRVGKKATSKCYVCLFTCMASRAVHLELVPEMTTARVMQALRRFIARRGRPEIIQSDNFRSFKAAASELRQLWRHVDVDRVQRELVGHRIHWKFITERAPWMGGYWERLVRSIKESLRKNLGRALLDEEELKTTLCEVEASLNARPLTFVGDEHHERHPLSLFQLLTGRAYVDILLRKQSSSTTKENTCFGKMHKVSLAQPAMDAFKALKKGIVNSVVTAIDDELPFTVGTDASHHAIAVTLSLLGNPVSFFSRMLSNSEQRHSSVGKEAYAIVEAIQKWRHYLLGHHFHLITDQRSVAFMFNNEQAGKAKNDKIMRWRLELSPYSYDIIYRSGDLNTKADALSRICGSIQVENVTLQTIHNNLCHPGVTRMAHYARSKNLPYTMEEIQRMTNSCRLCAELKPRFFKGDLGKLIKATAPFERLSIDFKGPLPSTSSNRYILTVVDECSRFPFAFPCPYISTQTVSKCLTQLFYLFGMPAYIHTDHGSSFMSNDLKTYLHSLGVVTSRTTAHNPQGNGQAERYNGIIWKAVTLALKSHNLRIEQWEEVIGLALHSIRTFLSTATNATPHERLFGYPRRTPTGTSLPTWLTTPGIVLMRRLNRTNKHDPLVEEVELLEANPKYAHVRLSDGRETTVSLKHLAPTGGKCVAEDGSPEETQVGTEAHREEDKKAEKPDAHEVIPENSESEEDTATRQEYHQTPQQPRRPTRITRAPQRLQDYVQY
ncbi:Retrovirus-related Pol polyprotein from transposon 17.6 [Trichinella sp. T6]|nr:Retrovirus-related Pol polyprotein from transposon 17.6 [Trichinella sp. T6]